MDGEQVTSRVDAGLRHVVVLALVSLAMIPVAFLSFGGRAVAEEPSAAVRFAVGSPAMLAAQDIARRNWGTDPCGGQIEIVWATDEPSVNARSYWANPRSAYNNPDLNTQCRIVFNTLLRFDWSKFCTVLVHEYGHLAGKPHTVDGGDVMSPIYRMPLPACTGAPDPSAAPPAPAPAPTTTPAGPSISRAATLQARRQAARAARAKARSRAKARAAEVGLRHYSNAATERSVHAFETGSRGCQPHPADATRTDRFARNQRRGR